MSDPSSPGGPYDRLDPDEARTTRIDFGQTPAGAPNTPWSAPQGDWGSPTPEARTPGGRATPSGAASRAVGWGAPSPEAGWTPLPGGGWRPPQGSDATFVAPPRQGFDPPQPPDDGAAAPYYPEAAAPRRRHRLARVGATALLVVAGTFLGVAISHDFWQSHPTTTAQAQPAGGSGRALRAARPSARRLRLERLVGRQRLRFGQLPVRQRRRLVVGRLVVGRLVELGDRRAEQPERDRRGGRPRAGRHQRHAGLPVRPGGGHGHRPELVGPRAHQQPRGRRRDRHQRHRRRQRQDLHGHRAGLRRQPRHRPDPAAERLGPEVGAARRLVQGLGRRRGRRPGQRRRRGRHAQRGGRFAGRPGPADHGGRRDVGQLRAAERHDPDRTPPSSPATPADRWSTPPDR